VCICCTHLWGKNRTFLGALDDSHMALELQQSKPTTEYRPQEPPPKWKKTYKIMPDHSCGATERLTFVLD